jgi:hypothetical protein
VNNVSLSIQNFAAKRKTKQKNKLKKYSIRAAAYRTPRLESGKLRPGK